MTFADDMRTKLIAAGVPLVLMPDQAYAMEQKGFDSFLGSHGTVGWTYLYAPMFIMSQEAMDTYMLRVSVYSKSDSASEALAKKVRKGLLGNGSRGSTGYTFINEVADPSKIGGYHRILTFEAVRFFNVLE